MPNSDPIEETKFACRTPSCTYFVWASYQEDAAFLPDDECPLCGGDVVDTDEKREVVRPLKTFIDQPH